MTLVHALKLYDIQTQSDDIQSYMASYEPFYAIDHIFAI